jgi:renalase
VVAALSSPRVLVVGAGISGTACAAALRAAGIGVTVRERGRAPGGRLAAPLLHGRRVDLGAAYFTVGDDDFAAVVHRWQEQGLVRPWTDTLDVFSTDSRRTSSGPMRWSAAAGLRSLARDLHPDVELEAEVTAIDPAFDVTVLAMPDPQAARLTADVVDRVEYEPVIAVAAGWAERDWPLAAAAFVNDDPDISLIADDGARRGDSAPVLVAHSTPELARRHLDDPEAAAAPVLAAVSRTLGLADAPRWTYVHRWTFAKPAGTHGDAPFLLGSTLGVCGDSWCPSGSPRVESAWLSGHRLGTELARRLAAA